MGRLLITFWLCQQQILKEPLLYLSYYFKQNRTEYYDRLMDIRKKGDWENWIKFFLKGIAIVSDEATDSARQIISLKEHCSNLLFHSKNRVSVHQRLLDVLFTSPIITRKFVAETLGISPPAARAIVDDFCELHILVDMTSEQRRNKRYVFKDYLTILEKGTELYSRR